MSASNNMFPSSRLLSIPHICAVFTCSKSWHRFVFCDFTWFFLVFVLFARWWYCLLFNVAMTQKEICVFYQFPRAEREAKEENWKRQKKKLAAKPQPPNRWWQMPSLHEYMSAPHYSSSHRSYISVHVYRTFTCKFMDNVRFYERSPINQAKWEPQNCWISITWHSELAFRRQWERTNERKTPTKSKENETASALYRVCVSERQSFSHSVFISSTLFSDLLFVFCYTPLLLFVSHQNSMRRHETKRRSHEMKSSAQQKCTRSLKLRVRAYKFLWTELKERE